MIEKMIHRIVYFILIHSKVRGFFITEHMLSVNIIDSCQFIQEAYDAVSKTKNMTAVWIKIKN